MDKSIEEGSNGRYGGFLGYVSCTTFNILAPIYKRLSGKNCCEDEYPELWLSRNDSILNRLLELKSSIICLQEFWVGNEELVRIYERRLGDAGYKTYILARTNNRGDGLLAAVHQNYFRVLNYKECLFNGFGDRVAQLLYVELLLPLEDQFSEIKRVLIVNTHLIFPHDSRYCFVRLQQVYKILQFIESYCHEYKLPAVPIILCGDWNGSMKGNVCKFLLSQGFVSTYDIAHPSVDRSGDPSKWVSHRNHRGNICAVDFVWLLNPNIHRKPLKRSFMEALLGNVYKRPNKDPTDGATPLPSQTEGSNMTYTQFSEALSEMQLIGPPYNVFSHEELMDLWKHLDTNEDGAVDISHFSGERDPSTSFQQKEAIEQILAQSRPTTSTLVDRSTIGLSVKKAMLSPPEVERGLWPEDYSLSDHAQLTVEFSVLQLHAS